MASTAERDSTLLNLPYVRDALVRAIISRKSSAGSDGEILSEIRSMLAEREINLNSAIGLSDDYSSAGLNGINSNSLLGVGGIRIDRDTSRELQSILNERDNIRSKLNKLVSQEDNRVDASPSWGEVKDNLSDAAAASLKKMTEARSEVNSFAAEMDAYLKYEQLPSGAVISKMIGRDFPVHYSISVKNIAHSAVNKLALLVGLKYAYTVDFGSGYLPHGLDDWVEGGVATGVVLGAIRPLTHNWDIARRIEQAIEPSEAYSAWTMGTTNNQTNQLDGSYYVLPSARRAFTQALTGIPKRIAGRISEYRKKW